jgi:hypothetical protein
MDKTKKGGILKDKKESEPAAPAGIGGLFSMLGNLSKAPA